MPLYNPSAVTVSNSSSATGTSSTVTSSVTSVTILPSNSNRQGATIWNNSTANLYIVFGITASTTAFLAKLSAGGYYEVPFRYTGGISGIWDANNGNALVTELT